MTRAERPERTVAALLASSLRDREWWDALEADDAGVERREEAARRAAALYRATAPLIPPRLEVDEAEPFDHAIGCLREIADTWAMRSIAWTDEERDALGVPTHRAIQLFVRLHDVDAWARGMGYALDLGDPNIPEEVWSDRREESDVSPADLARRCVDALATYEQVLGLRESEEGRELLQSEDFRRATCSEIAQGRAWVVWTRGHLASEVEPVALVMLAVAQGSFLLGCTPDDKAEVFPTLEYLRMLLAKTDANDWLLEQGAELPDWLG